MEKAGKLKGSRGAGPLGRGSGTASLRSCPRGSSHSELQEDRDNSHTPETYI